MARGLQGGLGSGLGFKSYVHTVTWLHGCFGPRLGTYLSFSLPPQIQRQLFHCDLFAASE